MNRQIQMTLFAGSEDALEALRHLSEMLARADYGIAQIIRSRISVLMNNLAGGLVFVGILLVVHFILCVFLIAVVLLQSGKSGDLAGAFGGGGGSQANVAAMSSENILTRATKISAFGFMATSLLLALFAHGDSGTDSVLDVVGDEAPIEAPLEPGTEPADDTTATDAAATETVTPDEVTPAEATPDEATPDEAPAAAPAAAADSSGD